MQHVRLAFAGVALIAGASAIASIAALAETPDRPGIENPIEQPAAAAPETPPAPAQSMPAVASAPAAKVEIDNFDFAPMMLKVTVGTTVTWANHDDVPHTVMSADDPVAFRSPALDTDDTFSFTFTKPGTYKYFCSVHPKMVGTVVVTAQP